MTSTIFFSNSRSLEQPGLIIETIEYTTTKTKSVPSYQIVAGAVAPGKTFSAAVTLGQQLMHLF